MELKKRILSKDLELRKDYILDRWVYIASGRKKRPQDHPSKIIKQPSKKCFFCPGHEDQTPKEIGRLEENNKWKIRWFPNKFPVVKPEGNPRQTTNKEFLKRQDSFGYHEVIIECPQHNKQLWDFDKKHINI